MLDPNLGAVSELLFPIERVVNEMGAVVGIAGGGDVIVGDSSGSDCPIGATCVRDAEWLPFGFRRGRVDTVASTDWWCTYPSGTHRVTQAGPQAEVDSFLADFEDRTGIAGERL